MRARGRFDVQGSINGLPFTGCAAWGEGVLRIPLSLELRAPMRVQNGDRVDIVIERIPSQDVHELPDALSAILHADAALSRAFAELPPSAKRAWAHHIAGAKRDETRERRLQQARVDIPARRYPR